MLRSDTLDRERTQLEAVAAAMADRFGRGGRLFTFGNGGSSTDAASIAMLFSSPPWGLLPARALVGDSAVLTALGNDVGFELVFSRQLIACANSRRHRHRHLDERQLAESPRRLPEAASRGVLTIGISGYDGGDMGRSDEVEHCFVVSSESVHRIQEAQGALAFALWSAVQECLTAVGGQRG